MREIGREMREIWERLRERGGKQENSWLVRRGGLISLILQKNEWGWNPESDATTKKETGTVYRQCM